MFVLKSAQLQKFASDDKEGMEALQLFFVNDDSGEGFTAGLLLEGTSESISANMVRVAKLISEKK